jgi:probable phosphoglycerate mutase
LTLFLLVRHAAHREQGRRLVGRLPGIELGDAGRQQAAALAARIAAAPVDRVLSGPLERAVETARAIAARAGRTVEVEAALDEIDYGAWTGRTIEDLAGLEAWRLWNSARSLHRVPGGESMIEVQSRMAILAAELRQRHPHGRLVLVSHQDPLKALLLAWLGMPLDFLERLELAPGSVTSVELFEEGAVLRRLNELG